METGERWMVGAKRDTGNGKNADGNGLGWDQDGRKRCVRSISWLFQKKKKFKETVCGASVRRAYSTAVPHNSNFETNG